MSITDLEPRALLRMMGQGGESSRESWNKTVADWPQQENNKRVSNWFIQVRTRAGERVARLASRRVSQFRLRRLQSFHEFTCVVKSGSTGVENGRKQIIHARTWRLNAHA